MNFANLRPEEILVFVSLCGGLLALIGSGLSVAALLDPAAAVEYLNGAKMMAGAWGGKPLGLALALALALWSRIRKPAPGPFLEVFA